MAVREEQLLSAPTPLPALHSPQAICRWELDAAMPGERAREVAVGFCAAVLSRLGKAVDAVVVEDRLAVLALPRLPAGPAGGEVAAVGLLVPRQPNGSSARALRKAITSLGRDGFRVGTRDLRLRSARSVAYDPHRWVGPSRVWTSVTPWMPETGTLERPASRRQAQLLDSLSLSLSADRDGRTAPPIAELVAEVQAHDEAWIPGLPTARTFGDRRTGSSSHVRISFREPIEGPIAIGRDRLLGMGLLAPIELPAEPWELAEVTG